VADAECREPAFCNGYRLMVIHDWGGLLTTDLLAGSASNFTPLRLVPLFPLT
jgi:hypothetical protein